MLRMVENGDGYNYICGLGEIPLAKGLINIVNFEIEEKPQESNVTEEVISDEDPQD